jgi:hypothetical protein
MHPEPLQPWPEPPRVVYATDNLAFGATANVSALLMMGGEIPAILTAGIGYPVGGDFGARGVSPACRAKLSIPTFTLTNRRHAQSRNLEQWLGDCRGVVEPLFPALLPRSSVWSGGRSRSPCGIVKCALQRVVAVGLELLRHHR